MIYFMGLIDSLSSNLQEANNKIIPFSLLISERGTNTYLLTNICAFNKLFASKPRHDKISRLTPTCEYEEECFFFSADVEHLYDVENELDAVSEHHKEGDQVEEV